MKVFHLFFILSLVQIINGSVRCSGGTKSVRTRQIIKSELKNQNSIYFVTDYAFLNESGSVNEYPFVKLLILSANFDVPIMFINFSDAFLLKIYSNVVTFSSTLPNVLGVNQKLKISLKNEMCSKNNFNVKEWIVKSNVSFCFAMFACHISSIDNQPSIRKELIFLSNTQLNQSTLQLVESGSSFFKRKFLSFIEFDNKGFCICDDGLLNYINDCVEEKADLSNMYVLLTILVFMVTVFIVFEIHERMARKRRVTIR